MAAPLKLAATVTLDASQVPAGAQTTKQAIASIGTEATASAAKIQKLIDTQLGLSRPAANSNSRAAEIAAYGAELDRLRAKYNPLYAVTMQYKTAVSEIRQAHKQGAISTDEMTAAVSRHRQATLASIDAIKGRNKAMQTLSNGGGLNGFSAVNAMYQFQDIGVTAAMGMSPGMIGLQQGSQLAGAYAGMGLKDAAKTTGSAIAGLVSPTSIAAIGLTAAAAAAIQFGMNMGTASKDAKKLEDVLAGHADTVSRLKSQYGDLGSAIKTAMPIGGAGYTDAQARNEITTLETALKAQSKDMASAAGGALKGGLLGDSTSGLNTLLATSGSPYQKQIDDLLASMRAGKGDLNSFQSQLESTFDQLRKGTDAPAKLYEEMERLSDAAQDAFSIKPKYEPFQAEIAKLSLGLKDGKADLSDFATNVNRIGQLNGIQKVADEIILASKGTIELAEKLREVKAILQEIDRENTRSGLSAQRELSRYVNQRDAETRAVNDKFAADQQMVLARTNAEKLAAVEAQVRSTARQDGDKDGGLQARVDRALTAERNRQAVEARDAALQRATATDTAISQQRLELSLIGQTTAAKEAQLYAEQQIVAIREEAARKGVPADEQEIANIRRKAAEYGRLKAEIEATTYLREQTQSVDRLRYQTSIAGKSKPDQDALLARYDAEVKIRELGADPTSKRAEEIRQTAAAIAAWNTQLAKTAEAWNKVRSTSESAIDGIVDGLASGNIGDALESISKDVQKTVLDLAVKNPLKNALTGSSYGTVADLKTPDGFAKTLFGSAQSVGSMNVTAASVMINGGVAGGLGNSALQAANSNTASGSIMGQAMGFGGNYKSAGVDPRLTDILNTAAQRTGGYKVDAISGFRAGDPRLHGQGLATDVQLTDLLSGKKLGNYQDASSFGAYEKFAQTARAVQMEKYPELANDFRWGGYFSGEKGKYGALDTMHFDLGGSKTGMGGGSWDKGLTSAQASLWPGIQSSGTQATQALNRLASGTAAANQNLGVFGNGLGQMGNGLKNSFSDAGGSSGGFGWLSSLFGSNSITSSSFQTNTTLGSFLTTGFDGGGWTGYGGRKEPAGVVHKGEVVWSQDDVARAGGPATVDAMRLGYRGYDRGGVVGGSAAARASSNDNGNGNIVIHNYSGANVQAEQTTDDKGRRQTAFVISDMVGDGMAAKGGKAGKTLAQQYGVKRRGIAR